MAATKGKGDKTLIKMSLKNSSKILSWIVPVNIACTVIWKATSHGSTELSQQRNIKRIMIGDRVVYDEDQESDSPIVDTIKVPISYTLETI